MWWDKPIPKKKVKCRICGHVLDVETNRRKWIIGRCPKCCDEHTMCGHDILKEKTIAKNGKKV